MKILVTGGCGFIGSNLVKELLAQGHNVTSIDDYSAGKVQNHWMGAEYRNMHTVEIPSCTWGETKFDLIYHLGEYSRIATSYKDIRTVWESNVRGTFEVLELALQHGAKVVYAGSSTKFAAEGIHHSPYAFTKAQNTELIKNYSKWFDLKYAICYFYNVFGPGYDSSPVPGYESVVSVFEKQWRAGQPLTITGTGQQKRAFTYVEDVVRGLCLAAAYPENEEFQLNRDKQHSILEIAQMFSDNIKYIPSRVGDRAESTATDNKARELLGWHTTMCVSEWIQYVKE